MSGRCVLFPARFVAGAVVAGGWLSPGVSSSSPVVAAVGLAVAASQRLVALGGQRAGVCKSNAANQMKSASPPLEERKNDERPTLPTLHRFATTNAHPDSSLAGHRTSLRFAPSIRLNQVERPRAPVAPG